MYIVGIFCNAEYISPFNLSDRKYINQSHIFDHFQSYSNLRWYLKPFGKLGSRDSKLGGSKLLLLFPYCYSHDPNGSTNSQSHTVVGLKMWSGRIHQCKTSTDEEMIKPSYYLSMYLPD